MGVGPEILHTIKSKGGKVGIQVETRGGGT